MVRRLAMFAMVLSVFLGSCGSDSSCDISAESSGTVTADEVCTVAIDSTSESSEGYAIVGSVGGQLLKLAYAKYSATGAAEKELSELPRNLFSINLERLYRDVKTAVE